MITIIGDEHMTDHQQKTILLVEDEAPTALLEIRQLRQGGYRVMHVFTGERAVEIMDRGEERIDLILLDIDLGKGIDGTEAAKRILQQYDIPLIFLSAHTEPEVVEKTEGITSYGYIVKNTGPTVLLASITMAFRLFEAKRREKEIEAAKRESEARYRTCIDGTPDLVFLKDEEHRYIMANRALAEFFNRTPDEVVGLSDHDLMPGSMADACLDSDARALEKDSVVVTEEYANDRVLETIKFPVPLGTGGVGVGGIIRDITERRRTEDDLREERRRMEYILGATRTGMNITDPDFNLLYVDPAWKTTYGDPAGRTCHDYFMGLEEPCPMCSIPLALETKRPVVRDVVLPREGNRIVEVHTIPFRSPSGEWLVAEFNIDITERKRTEAVLREGEERYRTLVDTLFDAVYGLSKDGTITLLNPVFEKLTGWPVSEWIDRSFAPLVHPEDLPMALETLRRVFQGERPPPYELRILTKTGEYLTAEFISRPDIRDGKVVGKFGIVRDISERKRAEEALLESEASLQAVLHATADGILAIGKDNSVLYANGRFADMWGIPPAIPERRNDSDLLHSVLDQLADPDGFLEKVQKLQDSHDENFDTIHFKDGRVFERLSRPLMKGEEVSGRVLSFRDISSRKRAEEDMARLSRALAEKNEELQQFIYIASHDLRSPMVNIKGFSQILKESADTLMQELGGMELPEEVRQRLSTITDEDIPDAVRFIEASIDKIESLIRGMLRISRIDTMEIHPVPLDMNGMMATIHRTFEFPIRNRDVSVTMGDLPDCLGDEGQINQVFSNLLDNALKYLDPGRPGEVRISGERRDGRCVYSVQDNGMGIPAEHREKIFRLFHRIRPVQIPGEGIGLSAVKRILDRHGGEIRVESEPGRGTTFHVTLPSS